MRHFFIVDDGFQVLLEASVCLDCSGNDDVKGKDAWFLREFEKVLFWFAKGDIEVFFLIVLGTELRREYRIGDQSFIWNFST